MQDQNEVFEKIPEFIIDSRKSGSMSDLPAPSEKQVTETEPVNLETIISSLTEDEQKKIKKSLTAPSQLRIELPQTLIDFDNYKGDLPSLFKTLSPLFQLISKWQEDTPLEITGKFPGNDIITLLNNLAYLPNHPYLGNVLEILANCIENEKLEIGTVMDTEIVFQGFKRIYNQRVQAILLPLLFLTYDLDKKLLPLKKQAWQVLNKSGRNYDSALIMDDIQKSMVRIKKAKELLTQEKYNLEQNFEENIDLLLLLTNKNDAFYPVYKVYQESLTNPGLNIEQALCQAYKTDNIVPKPLSQFLLTYKTGTIADEITKKIMRWSGKNSEPQFKQYLCACYSEILSISDIYDKNFQNVLREIIFATMDIARRRAWPSPEVIKDMVFALLASDFVSDLNQSSEGIPVLTLNISKLKILCYFLGSEVIAGVIKIKYRVDEAVQGLARGIVNLIPAAIECKNSPENYQTNPIDKKEFFASKINYKIISEYIYAGLWDTSMEIYPNFLTIEKNATLFVSTLKAETQLLKAKLQDDELKVFEKNSILT